MDGTVASGIRCAILCGFRTGRLDNSGAGGGNFVGIGDIILNSQGPMSVAAKDVIGSCAWKIYMC